MLRRDFALDKGVAEARAYVYGLGFYELRLNGNKVGDRVLTPASTPYGQRSFFDTYDVTDDVRRGANAVGVWLGNGYGANYNQYGFRWLGPKQAIVLIDVTYTDGSHHTISTDRRWKWSTGAIVGNDIYNGETYDARLAQQGWDRLGFDDSKWRPTKAVTAPSTDLAPNTMPAIRLAETLRPIALTQPKPGVFIYDLGQNIAGWTQLTVKGTRGTAIKLRAAEELGRDGSSTPRPTAARQRPTPTCSAATALRSTTPLHLPRLPVRRTDRLPGPAHAQHSPGPGSPRRSGVHRNLRVQQRTASTPSTCATCHPVRRCPATRPKRSTRTWPVARSLWPGRFSSSTAIVRRSPRPTRR